MAEELPTNQAVENRPENEHQGDDHLDHLMVPAATSTPLLVSLIQSVKELINPPKLPPLEVTSKPIEVDDGKGLYAGNEWKAGLMSMGINGGILGLLLLIGTNKAVQEAIKEKVTLIAPVVNPPKPPKLPPKQQTAGGGGGGGEKLPESKGRLPKVAPKQFVPPTTHTVDNPKLAVQPTILGADIPNIDAPNIGNPLAAVGPASNGTGIGHGIGPGKGNGVGPGEGNGFGGGVFKVGGGVTSPVPISKPEPEYSEEARKAKHQGDVILSVVVDEKGMPQNITVRRGLGLGLDEKAIEAVQKWRFKAGMKDGKPVAVQVTVQVSFHLL
jgi:TonB family protein